MTQENQVETNRDVVQEPPENILAEGPFVYKHWKSYLNGVPIPSTFEFPLYTDARITGDIVVGLGPFLLLNALGFREDNSIHVGIVLRADYFYQEIDLTGEMKTDASDYHGGNLEDEIAALISLSLGIRVKAGDMSREFAENGDPRGRPVGYFGYGGASPTLLRRYSGDRFVIPTAIGQHCLDDMPLLPTLPLLRPPDAVALVIAARTYQNAMWISEAEPELAWLLMVSALETAAAHWSSGDDTPTERLQASKPELYDLLLRKGGEELVEQVAASIAPSLGVTSKFLRFMMTHLPEPPQTRPPEFCQVNWAEPSMKKVLSKVYSHRSAALHTGRPFPAPMCDYPSYRGDEGMDGFNETILGLAAGTIGATWLRKDVPIMLHTFEYITRNVLLNWWRAMLPVQA